MAQRSRSTHATRPSRWQIRSVASRQCTIHFADETQRLWAGVTPQGHIMINDRGMLPQPLWLPLDLPNELPDTLRCAYASKRCENVRTVKKSGGLHRFCAFHRDRANQNQWRVDHRRRMLKQQASPTNATPRRSRSPRCVADWKEHEAEAAADARREARRLKHAELVVDSYDICSSRENELDEQDVAILSELLLMDDTVPPIDAVTAWPVTPVAVRCETMETWHDGTTSDPLFVATV